MGSGLARPGKVFRRAVQRARSTGLLRPKAGRTRRLLEGFASALLSKGILIVVSILSIPIAVRYLGTESFGIWTTITTTLTMLLVLDLGVANSLTNFISEAYARNDPEHAGRYATTGLAVMTAISALLGATAWLLWPHLNWARLFHLSSAGEAGVVSLATAAALTLFLLDLPARLSIKILGGYQEVRIANVFAVVGGVANLAAIVLVVHLDAGLPAMVVASSGAVVGADVLCLLWLVGFHKPWLRPRVRHLSGPAARRMMRSGSEFFILQIAGLVAFNTDNLVIAHYLGPAQVAPYSIAWKVAGYAPLVQSLLTPALWPAYSEAFSRGDLGWVRSTFRRTTWITMGTALGFSLLFAIGGRWLIRVWTTRAVVPGETIVLLMCVWILINTFMSGTSTLLMARGETRIQARLSLLSALVNLALSIWLVRRVGSAGVILGTVLSYLGILVVPQTILAWNVLQGEGPRRLGLAPSWARRLLPFRTPGR